MRTPTSPALAPLAALVTPSTLSTSTSPSTTSRVMVVLVAVSAVAPSLLSALATVFLVSTLLVRSSLSSPFSVFGRLRSISCISTSRFACSTAESSRRCCRRPVPSAAARREAVVPANEGLALAASSEPSRSHPWCSSRAAAFSKRWRTSGSFSSSWKVSTSVVQKVARSVATPISKMMTVVTIMMRQSHHSALRPKRSLSKKEPRTS